MAIYFDEERVELARYRIANNTKCHNICCELCEHCFNPCHTDNEQTLDLNGVDMFELFIDAMCK